MRLAYLLIFGVAMTAALTNSAYAYTPTVPDAASTAGLLGGGVVALVALRAYLKK